MDTHLPPYQILVLALALALSLMPPSHQTLRPVPTMKLLGIMSKTVDVGPPLPTILQPEMLTDGV